ACGSGAICITELQAAGSKRMTAAAFLAGRELAIGALFA
ncbi:methionyl-tRNA formyltransferase, partial [Kingella kingae]|nr:methionyl-tRNA formyltransferase [Kingella kingae]